MRFPWRRGPLRRWLIASHLLVLLLPLLALVGTGALGRDLLAQARISLLDQGALVSLLLQRELAHARAHTPGARLADLPLADLAPPLADAAHAAVRILDQDGRVVATSGPRQGEDLSQQPEVAAALQGHQAWEVRPLPPPSEGRPGPLPSQLERTRLYVTNPVVLDGEIVGAVLLSRSPRQTLEALRHMSPRLAAGLAVALALTLGLSLQAGHVFSRSLGALARAAHRIAEGQLSAAAELERPRASRLAEVHELAEAFAAMTERLQVRLGYARELASNVSHEFKTPLATLQGTIELLQDDPQMPDDQRARFLDNALAEVQRMSELVSGLLELARAEEAPAQTPVDLGALLAEIAGRYPGLAAEGEAGWVTGDPQALASVALNLLDNAHQHGAPPVLLRAWREEGWTGFTVTDRGPGIPAGNLPRLFDRFFTTDRERGTGLGLALVKTVCQAHGGTILATSVPGETTFAVRLPATRPP